MSTISSQATYTNFSLAHQTLTRANFELYNSKDFKKVTERVIKIAKNNNMTVAEFRLAQKEIPGLLVEPTLQGNLNEVRKCMGLLQALINSEIALVKLQQKNQVLANFEQAVSKHLNYLIMPIVRPADFDECMVSEHTKLGKLRQISQNKSLNVPFIAIYIGISGSVSYMPGQAIIDVITDYKKLRDSIQDKSDLVKFEYSSSLEQYFNEFYPKLLKTKRVYRKSGKESQSSPQLQDARTHYASLDQMFAALREQNSASRII